VPSARRSRVIPAAPEDLWRTVGDPHHLPRWWPRVERVESVDGTGFTELLRSDKGATVRADFRLLERREPSLIRWSQDVEGTPFERVLRGAETTIALAPADGGTIVELRLVQRLTGVARLGGFMVRGATGKQLSDALAQLNRLHGGEEE
jgi:uncharacterized protein YndB with AHSA1/START domain